MEAESLLTSSVKWNRLDSSQPAAVTTESIWDIPASCSLGPSVAAPPTFRYLWLWKQEEFTLKRLLGLASIVVAFVVWGIIFITDSISAHTRITTTVTWSEHIRPIFIEKCMVCHHLGGIAPDYLDLSIYGTDTIGGARAAALGMAIESEIRSGRMPPWQPDIRFGAFANENLLTNDEIDLISAWARGGAPQGPYRDLPVPKQLQGIDWRFGAPDLVFSLPQPYVLPPNEPLGEVSAVLPVEIEADSFITGFEFLVKNPKNIFRMTALLHDPEGIVIPPMELEALQKYDPLTKYEPKPVRKRPMPKGPHYIGQWVRGDGPVFFPDAAGHVIRQGSSIELRVEYRRPDFADWSQEIRDDSKLGLFLASPDEEIRRIVESTPLRKDNFLIEANAANQRVHVDFTTSESIHLIGINPDLGPLAINVEVKVTYPDSLSQTLIWIPEYKRAWTASYLFDPPVPAPAGTRISLVAHYDNTEDNPNNPNSPPRDVPFGQGWDAARLSSMLTYTLDDRIYVPEEIEVSAAQAGRPPLLTAN